MMEQLSSKAGGGADSIFGGADSIFGGVDDIAGGVDDIAFLHAAFLAALRWTFKPQSPTRQRHTFNRIGTGRAWNWFDIFRIVSIVNVQMQNKGTEDQWHSNYFGKFYAMWSTWLILLTLVVVAFKLFRRVIWFSHFHLLQVAEKFPIY